MDTLYLTGVKRHGESVVLVYVEQNRRVLVPTLPCTATSKDLFCICINYDLYQIVLCISDRKEWT
jgi:hypothetical protein